MRRENHGWSPREIERLRKMKAEGLDFTVIGQRLGKSRDTVGMKWRQLQEKDQERDAA